jgi:hypothetical protein
MVDAGVRVSHTPVYIACEPPMSYQQCSGQGDRHEVEACERPQSGLK